jgi:hypothetical protein
MSPPDDEDEDDDQDPWRDESDGSDGYQLEEK